MFAEFSGGQGPASDRFECVVVALGLGAAIGRRCTPESPSAPIAWSSAPVAWLSAPPDWSSGWLAPGAASLARIASQYAPASASRRPRIDRVPSRCCGPSVTLRCGPVPAPTVRGRPDRSSSTTDRQPCPDASGPNPAARSANCASAASRVPTSTQDGSCLWNVAMISTCSAPIESAGLGGGGGLPQRCQRFPGHRAARPQHCGVAQSVFGVLTRDP